MEKKISEILILDSLRIGYVSGRQENVLLPPLNARANKGELIALIGRNGIGKSTLLRTLTGLQSSLGGEIYYSGKNLKEYSRTELAQEVGYISTEIVKVDNMSVYDLVSLGRFPYTNWIGKIDTANHEVIMNSIEKTSMTAFCNRFVSELSDGERQRVMIARILAQDTEIMVMDEPTAYLDIGSKYEILHLLHILSQKNNKTIIFSTHDLNMATSQADKIWLMLEDKLIDGAPEDLMIEGAFDHLFDSSPVQFNYEQGTYSIRREEKESIFVDGDGILCHWTKNAVIRAGFSVSKTRTNPFLKVPSGNNRKWQLISNNSLMEFDSIYEFVNHICREDIFSI